MAIDSVLDIAPDIIIEIGKLGRWIQALGLVVIIWIVVQAITLYFNRRRRKILEKLQLDVERIENKIDKLNGKIKS